MADSVLCDLLGRRLERIMSMDLSLGLILMLDLYLLLLRRLFDGRCHQRLCHGPIARSGANTLRLAGSYGL